MSREVKMLKLYKDRIDLEVLKAVNGMTGNQGIDNLVKEQKQHSHESDLRYQQLKNKYFDCCIEDLVNSLR